MCKPFSQVHVLRLSGQSHKISLQNKCSVFLFEEELRRIIWLALHALLRGERGGTWELWDAIISSIACGRRSWRAITTLAIIVTIGPLPKLATMIHNEVEVSYVVSKKWRKQYRV